MSEYDYQCKYYICNYLYSFSNWIRGPLDKYGFSYFLATRINIMLVICGTAAAAKNGFDVSIFAYL
jgi:hypothetical protein